MEFDTDHHGLQLHAVWWNTTPTMLESLLQVLLTRFSYACLSDIRHNC